MNAGDKTASNRDRIMTLRAHLFAAFFLGTSSTIAIACSSATPGEEVRVTTEALGDELAAYAADCDSTMGAAATVPAFDCDTDGIDIPVTVNGAPFVPGVDVQCDAPDQFNADCIQHQKLVPLASTATATTVAICRRFTATSGPGYDEVDVIQHNKSTGDTCFYVSTMQLPDGSIRPFGSIPGNAPAPSAGVGTTGSFPYWETPTQLASNGPDGASACIQCHDNGAFIRSPFVKQVASQLPSAFVNDLGFGNDAYNLTQPYHIHGSAFAAAGWRAVSISLTDDSTCTGCHRMGANTVNEGTSELFGPTSVACYTNYKFPDISQAPLGHRCGEYNGGFVPPNAQDISAPHWMIPANTLGLPSGQSFTPAFMTSALKYAACAQAWRTHQPMPADCQVHSLTQCIDNVKCMAGYHWDQTLCRCVHD
jgi:hypothetical protein